MRPLSTQIVLAATLALPVLAVAATPPAAAPVAEGQSAELMTARVTLGRQLTEWLQAALGGMAHPYRVLVTVQVAARTGVREVLVRQQAEPDADLKLAANKEIKLPGLPLVDKPLGGYGAPDISLKLPGRRTTETEKKYETIIERIAVRIFVEKGMPEDRVEALRKATLDLAGLDLTKGDSIELGQLPPPPAVAPPPPVTPQSFLEKYANALLGSLALLLSSLVVAVSLSAGRRRSDAAVGGGGGGGGESNGAAAFAESPEERAAVQALGSGEEQAKPRAFSFLSDLSQDQLVEVLTGLDRGAVAAILDQASPPAGAVRLYLAELSAQDQVALAQALGRSRIATIDEVTALEQKARAKADDVRRHVKLGGEARLAQVLSLAPAGAQKAVLEALAQKDAELARALRAHLPLFEDLADLPAAAVRLVAAACQPATLALSLRGAPAPLLDHVMASVSKRLQGILGAEAANLGEKSDAEFEAARKQVEDSLRRLHSKGMFVLPQRVPGARQ
ncbi:MAG TPA: FliG C-terminal domain-containing protein [Myxococcales bacterium]|jgi:flagellar motor switch protein FliG